MTLSPPVPVLDTTVLTPFQRLTSEIEIAESKAVPTFGDYTVPAVNKAARSYVYGLRQLRSTIDRTRKAQNDEAQAYIRSVNGFAKELEARVTALIDPHERILKGIEEAEKERVAMHEGNLEVIIEMRSLDVGTTSGWIQSRLDKLTEFDPTTFEEFTPKAAAEIEITRSALEEALQVAIDHEAAEAERERLRQEEAEAARASRDADIAAAAAAAARREAEEAAEAALEVERKRAEEAEAARVAAEERGLRVHAQLEAELKKSAKAKPPEAAPAGGPTKAQRKVLSDAIVDYVLDHQPKAFAALLMEGAVHPAITIDWSKVEV